MASLSTALSRAPLGLAAPCVRVEVHLGPGLPAFALVGLPEAVVRESRERVRSAIQNSAFEFPPGRITVSLSPADLPKEGGRFDLPIAVGILAASGQLPSAALARCELYGELALSGELRETAKLLPALRAALAAGHEVILPAANELEARWVGSARIGLARDLRAVCAALGGTRTLRSPAPLADAAGAPPALCDLADVHGQFIAKRALEIAAAGAHGLLMIGPPGTGKTLLAQCLPGLMPALSPGEALEIASLESAAGARPAPCARRPFRAPQHTASMAALIGAAFRPGEIARAHLGVLFLDELPEFPRNALEALREPLESGSVLLARARRTVEFPASFQLVAAMNPCPCGYVGEPSGRCRCTRSQIERYRSRLSGPLLDRIDLHVALGALPAEELGGGSRAESSAEVAARVARAHARQLARQGKANGRLGVREVQERCALDRSSRALIESATRRFRLSARGFHRLLRVARTCADLAGESEIRPQDISEAIALRALDRTEP